MENIVKVYKADTQRQHFRGAQKNTSLKYFWEIPR